MGGDGKGWFLLVLWLLAGLMWCIFALLFFWIHHRFFALSFLLLGFLAFFIAVRWQRQRARQKDQGR